MPEQDSDGKTVQGHNGKFSEPQDAASVRYGLFPRPQEAGVREYDKAGKARAEGRASRRPMFTGYGSEEQEATSVS